MAILFPRHQDRVRVRVLLALLEDVMYESLFDELRTKQQLGYSVGCSIRDACPKEDSTRPPFIEAASVALLC